jgi:hypothetical protein
MEIISDEAKAYLERIEQEKKVKAKAVAASKAGA